MENCIFCQIVAGKSQSHKVYEDELFLGFLDKFPRTKGHTLLIPKTHYRWVYDIPEFSKYWEVVLKVTKALQKAVSPYFITYVTHGLEIEHAHVHILPRTLGETSFVPVAKQSASKKMQEIADLIKNSL